MRISERIGAIAIVMAGAAPAVGSGSDRGSIRWLA